MKHQIDENLENNEKIDISNNLIKGTFRFSILRGIAHIFELIINVILPLLILPAELGVWQLLLSVTGFFSTIFYFEMEISLIQKKTDELEEYLNSVWSFNLIKGLVLFSVNIIIAGVIATLFEIPELIIYIQVFSLTYLFQGFKNLRIINLYKELKFKNILLIDQGSAIFSSIILISLLLLQFSIWAFLISYVSISLCQMIGSYILYPKLLKFQLDFSKLKELLNFQIWIYFSVILYFFYFQGIYLWIFWLYGIAIMGLFQYSFKIVNILSNEISLLSEKILFPVFSELQNDKNRLKELYFFILQISSLIAFYISAMLFLYVSDIVNLFFDQSWQFVIPLIQILSIYGLVRTIGFSTMMVLRAINKPKIITINQIIHILLIIIFFLLLLPYYNIFAMVYALVLSVLIFYFSMMIYVMRELSIKFIRILKTFLGLSSSIFLMIICSTFLKFTFSDSFNVWGLLVLMFSSTLLYLLLIFIHNYVFKMDIIQNLKLLKEKMFTIFKLNDKRKNSN